MPPRQATRTTTERPAPTEPPRDLLAVVSEIERAIDSQLNEPDFPEPLKGAVRYAALGAGKRLRPSLTLLSCEAAGVDRARAMTPAVAVELIHAFSLVHDDLPALDDDDLRRGRPTLHVRFDEATAILAGDAMMSMAFGLLARTPYAGPETTTTLVRELAEATNRMIAGQALDTVGAPEIQAADPQTLVRSIHEQKTGALIRAACRMGAIAAGASEDVLSAITRYGGAVGLMFQIIDDLIDVEQHASHTGKKTGKDAHAGKLTYPGVFGVSAARAEALNLRDAAFDAIEPLGNKGRTLEELADHLARRTR